MFYFVVVLILKKRPKKKKKKMMTTTTPLRRTSAAYLRKTGSLFSNHVFSVTCLLVSIVTKSAMFSALTG